MNSNTVVSLDPYQRFSTDPCRHKHHGSETSQLAWEKAKHGMAECRRIIVDLLQSIYPAGMTCREMALHLDKGMNAISGRITGLVNDEIILRRETRAGGRVCYFNPDFQPAAALERADLIPVGVSVQPREEISRLVEAGDDWGARSDRTDCREPIPKSAESS